MQNPKMKKTKFPSFLITFAISYLFWIFLTWSVEPQELVAGAVVCVAVALFSARFFVHNDGTGFGNPLKIFVSLYYSFVIFIIELFKANWDMAKRCYGGCKKVNPGIVKVPVELKSDYGLANLANSITLTPGTITMEITEEDGQNYFYVHWIDVTKPSGKEAGDEIKGVLEKWVGRVWP